MKSLIGLFFILFAGCAAPPQQHELKKDFLLPRVDRDTAWSAIVGLFAEVRMSYKPLEQSKKGGPAHSAQPAESVEPDESDELLKEEKSPKE